MAAISTRKVGAAEIHHLTQVSNVATINNNVTDTFTRDRLGGNGR